MHADGGVPLQRPFFAVYVSLLMLVSLAALDQTVVSVAVPSMIKELGGPELYAWVGAAYLLASACFAPLYGKLADVLGRKITVLIALGAFLVGSLLCSIATGMWFLVFSRAIQGVGGGGLMQSVRIITADITTVSERGKYIGGISAAWGLSTTLGAFVGGAAITLFSWRSIFILNIPIGLAAGFVLSQSLNVPLRETKSLQEHAKAFDMLGLTLIGGGSAIFLFGLNRGASGILLALAGGAALAYGAVHETTTTKSPIIPPRLFQRGYPALVTLITGLHNLIAINLSYYLPLYFQILGNSPLQAGILTIPFALGSALTSTGTGFLLAKHPHHRLLMLSAMGVMMLGLCGMSGLSENSPSILRQIAIVMTALGIGPMWTLTLVALQLLVPKQELATATTGFGLVRSLSGALGVTLGAAIYSFELSVRLPSVPGITPSVLASSIDAIQGIKPPVLREAVQHQHALALRVVWMTFVPVGCIALGLCSRLPSILQPDVVQYEAHSLSVTKSTADEESAALLQEDVE